MQEKIHIENDREPKMFGLNEAFQHIRTSANSFTFSRSSHCSFVSDALHKVIYYGHAIQLKAHLIKLPQRLRARTMQKSRKASAGAEKCKSIKLWLPHKFAYLISLLFSANLSLNENRNRLAKCHPQTVREPTSKFPSKAIF